MDKTEKKILAWAVVIGWMSLIFILSSQPATQSNGLSKGITHLFLDVIARIFPVDIEVSTIESHVSAINNVARKCAHFALYFILALLTANASTLSCEKTYKSFIISFFICFFYAVGDEIHQLFVPGRGGQLRDVLIDTTGALSGLIIYYGVVYTARIKKFRILFVKRS